MTYNAIPQRKGISRPYLSEAGPYNHGPAAIPRKNAVMIQATSAEPGAIPYSARISGKAGNMMSIAIAVLDMNAMTETTNSRSPTCRVDCTSSQYAPVGRATQ